MRIARIEVVESDNLEQKQRWWMRLVFSNGKIHMRTETLMHRAYAMRVAEKESAIRCGVPIVIVDAAEKARRAEKDARKAARAARKAKA